MLSAVKEWAKDKPYIIAFVAPHFVTAVRDFHLDCQHLKSRRFGKHQFRLNHLQPWFRLYRSHRKGTKFLRDMFTIIIGKETIDCIDTLKNELDNVFKLDKEALIENLPTPEQFEEIRQVMNEFLEESYKDIEEDFADTPLDPDDQGAMKKLVDDNPLDSSFFLFVTFPCWLLYRMSPTQLYFKARSGDFDALERILRLDPLMIHNPYIGIQIAQCRFNRQSAKYRKLMASPYKPPKGGTDRKNVMISTVGLINALSHVINKPLLVREVFDLMAAIDQDCGSNLLEALPKEPDALSRALQPDRNLWRQAFKPDRKK